MLSDLARPEPALRTSPAGRCRSDDGRKLELPGLGGGVARGVIGPGIESRVLIERRKPSAGEGALVGGGAASDSCRHPIGGDAPLLNVELLGAESRARDG